MFYIIGLGLGSERDITVKGLEIVRKCHKVYLESYTSILAVSHAALEEFYGREVIVSDRECIESQCDKIIDDASEHDVAMLVVGDPLGATTHTDIILRARQRQVKYKVIHNASIYNAVASCGLQLYSFGKTISIPFFTETWKPLSFYDKIKENIAGGDSHTLVLLDIKVKEISDENLARGKRIFEPPRFMTIAQACQQLLEAEQRRNEGVLSEKTLAVGLARVGAEDEQIKCGTLATLKDYDFGGPLHTMVLIGKEVHDLELDFLQDFAVDAMDFFNGIGELRSKN